MNQVDLYQINQIRKELNKMNDYPTQEVPKYLGGLTRIPVTVRERLEERKTVLEAQLNEIKIALELLDKNPSFEEVHNAIAKAGY